MIMKSRYEQFINSRPPRVKRRNDGLEVHHIIPKSIDPTIAKNPTNLIALTPREHYLAHWMLAKIYQGKMWFAFNQMKRVIVGERKTSALYSLARKYIANELSKCNTGKIHTEERRKGISERTKNTVIVKSVDNVNGPNFRVSCTDERYISGELVFYRTGSTHSEETIAKMITNNGLVGKNIYSNELLQTTIYLGPDEEVPLGFVQGPLNKFREDARIKFTQSPFIHNPITGEQRRLQNGNLIPEGFVLGRIFGTENGLSVMNDKSKIKVFDLLHHKKMLIYPVDIQPYHVYSPANSKAVRIGKYIFESMSCFNYIFDGQPPISVKTLHSKFCPHPSMIKQRHEFCRRFEGLSYAEIGIRLETIRDVVVGAGNIVIRKDTKHLLNYTEYAMMLTSNQIDTEVHDEFRKIE